MKRLGLWAVFTGFALTAGALKAEPGEPSSSPDAAHVALPSPNAVSRSTMASRVYDLKRCLELAAQNFPRVLEAEARLKKKQSELGRAYSQPYSSLSSRAGILPAPTLWGDAVYSPSTDVSLSSNLSLSWRFQGDYTLPIWTFGKITNGIDAAKANVAVGKHEVRKNKNEAMLNVRRAYYGTLLARDSLALVREAQGRIDGYVEDLQRKVDDGDGDDVQLLRLRMSRAELDARESEARRQEAIALSGLRFLTGVEGTFDVPNQPLPRVQHRLGPLARYLHAARLYRPEVNMAKAGVAAREALLRLERARLYPDIGMNFVWRWARSADVTDQRNPFVRDEANYHYYGFGFGMEWKMDFVPALQRIKGAKAELEEMQATERLALGFVGSEVEQAYAEATDAERRLDAWSKALSYAKQWLVKVQQGIDVGTREDADLVDPAKEYALKRFNELSAIYDYDVAVARLSMATGWDSIAD